MYILLGGTAPFPYENTPLSLSIIGEQKQVSGNPVPFQTPTLPLLFPILPNPPNCNPLNQKNLTPPTLFPVLSAHTRTHTHTYSPPRTHIESDGFYVSHIARRIIYLSRKQDECSLSLSKSVWPLLRTPPPHTGATFSPIPPYLNHCSPTNLFLPQFIPSPFLHPLFPQWRLLNKIKTF